MHAYGIWKDDTDEPICGAAVETHRRDCGGRGGSGGEGGADAE